MKILNFGSCNVDYVYLLDHIVAPGETEATDKLSVFPGGKGLNQSIALARAGADVYHAGCIGEDGAFLADMLRENGVNVTHLKRVNAKNGHAVIQVSREGENSIFLFPGSNTMIEQADIDRVLENFGTGDLVLLQNEINNLDYIIKKAHARGMRIALNPSPCNETVLALDLTKLTYLILNEIEAKTLSGKEAAAEALAYFKAQYPALTVVLTRGKQGSVYQDSSTTHHQESLCVKAVDTTAAGDTFTGYFLASITAGLKPRDAMQLASFAAGIAVSRRGAAPSIPRLFEVKEAIFGTNKA